MMNNKFTIPHWGTSKAFGYLTKTTQIFEQKNNNIFLGTIFGEAIGEYNT